MRSDSLRRARRTVKRFAPVPRRNLGVRAPELMDDHLGRVRATVREVRNDREYAGDDDFRYGNIAEVVAHGIRRVL
jgi:hypothetical protein